MTSLPEPAQKLGILLGEWFALNLKRLPTRDEVRIATKELGQTDGSIDSLKAAMQRTATALGLKECLIP